MNDDTGERRTFHISTRGNNKRAIYADDGDRDRWFVILSKVCDAFGWTCHAWVLMTNHYHLLVTADPATLGPAMNLLNGHYAIQSNVAQERVDHVFGGRYWAALIDSDDYFDRTAAYIHCNPVRAGLAETAEAYRWSSLPAILGESACPWFLDPAPVLAPFTADPLGAREAYRTFLRTVPQRLPELPPTADPSEVLAAMRRGLTTSQIADALGLHRTTVWRMVVKARAAAGRDA